MNKEVYEFLNSARVLNLRWLRLKSKHDELESCLLPAAIRYDKDKVQTSPEDTMSKIIAEINVLEAEMAAVQIARAKRINDIDKALNSLESDEIRAALSMRFINRKPVSEIAEQMGYAESTIYYFFNQGSKELQKIIRIIN